MRTVMRGLGMTALFLFVLEVCARAEDAWSWDAPMLAPYSHERLTVRDTLGVRNRAGYRFEKWRINSNGFRGSDIAQRPADGVSRVAVLGASETFGLFEGENGDYPAQLGAALDSSAAGRFEVVNVARAGMMLPSMPGYYRRFVAPIEPAVVVVYPTPAFYLMEAVPRVTDPARLRAETETSAGSTLAEGLTESRLLPKLRQVVKSFVPLEIQNRVKEWKLARVRAAHSPDWVWPDVPADRMARFEADLAALVDSIRADGVEVLLVGHVNRLEKPSSEWTFEDRYHLLSNIQGNSPQASDAAMVGVDAVARLAMQRVAQGHGASYLELAGEIPPTAEFFADYSHFTDVGAARVARLIAGRLLAMRGIAAELR